MSLSAPLFLWHAVLPLVFLRDLHTIYHYSILFLPLSVFPVLLVVFLHSYVILFSSSLLIHDPYIFGFLAGRLVLRCCRYFRFAACCSTSQCYRKFGLAACAIPSTCVPSISGSLPVIFHLSVLPVFQSCCLFCSTYKCRRYFRFPAPVLPVFQVRCLYCSTYQCYRFFNLTAYNVPPTSVTTIF